MVSDITSGVLVYLEYSGLAAVYIRFFTAEFYSEIAIMVAVKLLQFNLKKFCEYLIENSLGWLLLHIMKLMKYTSIEPFSKPRFKVIPCLRSVLKFQPNLSDAFSSLNF